MGRALRGDEPRPATAEMCTPRFYLASRTEAAASDGVQAPEAAPAALFPSVRARPSALRPGNEKPCTFLAALSERLSQYHVSRLGRL